MTKKIIISLIAALLLVAIAVPAAAANGQELTDEGLKGQARGALNNCLAGMEGGGSDLFFTVLEGTPCFAGGSMKTVTVYRMVAPHCPPGQICPLYIILWQKVGEVTFDCEDNIVDVKCCADSSCDLVYI